MKESNRKETKMIEQQIKPLSIKLTIALNIHEYKLALAKNYNVKPEEIEVIIEDEHNERADHIANTESDLEPKKGKIIGNEKKKVERYFLDEFLKESKFSHEQVTELCHVGKTTVQRARYGFRLRKESFNAIVKGLELTAEQAKEFKKSLHRKQSDCHKKGN